MRLNHTLLARLQSTDPAERKFLGAAGVASLALLASFALVVDAAVDDAPKRQAEIQARGADLAAARLALFKRGEKSRPAPWATTADEAVSAAHRIVTTGR